VDVVSREGVALSAVEQVTATFGIPVTAVATLTALISYLEAACAAGKTVGGVTTAELPTVLAGVRDYREKWGTRGE